MIKLKKKLGEGVNGTVYLCEYKGRNMIYKIEKYNNDKSTKSSFIRELEFSKFAKLLSICNMLLLNTITYSKTMVNNLTNVCVSLSSIKTFPIKNI